jgi:CRP/FNR family cyclic AMP-dependent transcriptional regulator
MTDGAPPAGSFHLATHQFFHGLDADLLAVLQRTARVRSFATGEMLLREGDPADAFFLVLHGKVALEYAGPSPVHRILQTIGRGEVLGWSWLVPPYRWRLDARAVKPTEAILLDAPALRAALDAHPAAGYHFLARLLPVVAERLENTRLQLVEADGS